MAKGNEKAMELEIKTLQKHMGGLVKTVLDLKSKVEALEKKPGEYLLDEVEKILERQRINDKAIAANNDAILKIDKEMHALSKTKQNDDIENESGDKDLIKDATKNSSTVKETDVTRKYLRKKCRYFNRGYCKMSKCRYIHPEKICNIYLNGEKCESSCPDRHPKLCKWIKNGGCKRQNCVYLHTQGSFDIVTCRKYKCEGCKTVWENEKHVVEHKIQNMQTFFCLNCEDWIRNKENVFVAGWTLFDDEGYLRNDL